MDNQQPSVNYRSFNKNAQKYQVNIGDIFGVYKVVEEVKIPTKRCVTTKWKCVNINNDKEYIYSASYLHHLRDRVNAKFEQNHQIGLRNFLYRDTMRNAKNRNHSFNLTFEQFNDIISQNCHYCGAEPKLASKETILHRGDCFQPPIRYNGIDRLDPNIGYEVENCVPCCSICNYMKHVQTKEFFLRHIEKIYDFSINKGSTTIPKGSTSQANGGGNGGLLTSKVEDEDIVSPV
jgi:hypothetical protein